MDVYCDMNGDGWAYPHCPAVGGCITSYTKERRGPSSSWGADTENGHTASGTPSLATNPHTLLRRTQSCFSRSYGCSHFSFHHQTMGFFTGAGGRAALRKLCTRPVCVHECEAFRWVCVPGRHWRGCYGCRVEKGSRLSFPLSGPLSQVVFN